MRRGNHGDQGELGRGSKDLQADRHHLSSLGRRDLHLCLPTTTFMPPFLAVSAARNGGELAFLSLVILESSRTHIALQYGKDSGVSFFSQQTKVPLPDPPPQFIFRTVLVTS
jgi:hypothetical protein